MSGTVAPIVSTASATKAPRPGIRVVGGTYADMELLVNGPIAPDTSLEVARRTMVLGGAGFCFAVQLANLGFCVEFRTILGTCAWSARARQALLDRGILVSGEQKVGALDVATLVIEPTGRKLALNDYGLARRVACVPELLASTDPVLIASPTSIRSVVEAVRLVRENQTLPPLYLAPHSFQVRQMKSLVRADRNVLAAATRIACFHESDFDSELEAAFPPQVHLIVTCGAGGSRLRRRGQWSAFPAPKLTEPMRNPNGAGEAFFAGVLAAVARGHPLDQAIGDGSFAAAKHLTSNTDSVESANGSDAFTQRPEIG
jgi:sugar/nucleoside kinase (ribokinase family)